MEESLAKRIIVETFENEFDEGQFKYFARNLFIGLEERAVNLPVTSPFDSTIEKATKIGVYSDNDKNDIHILIVELKRDHSIEYARATQRNFVAKYLKDQLLDSALVVFYSESSSRWRLSFIKREYILESRKDVFSPVKRFSYLLGENESSHTAQKQFLRFFTTSNYDQSITLNDLQDIFSLETVTEEFFDGFLKIFNQLWKYILNQLKKQRDDYLEISKDATLQILNRLLFLYFIQRKSEWFDYIPHKKRLINFLVEEYQSSNQPEDTFFSHWLKVLFLETFNNKKTLLNTYSHAYFSENVRTVLYKMPYLNGGLFSENEYDKLEFSIPDKLMIDEIIAFLNTYNFTIIESMPLDKEVAINPEVIGTIYEKFVNLETTPELKEKYEAEGGSKGVIYTQEEEINLMCRKALVHYIDNNFDLPLEIVYNFIFNEEFTLTEVEHYEKLKQAIDRVKIVDPACGSGSFLVGMVNLLHELHKKLIPFNPAENPKDYAIRKHIIEENVYGVDIMEWAVRIAELRLWLFLIVESDLKWAELQLTPLLPNLSFKIRQGDSLIEEVGDVDLSAIRENRFISPSLKRKITELKKEKLRYTKNEKGHRPKWEIEKIEQDIYRRIISEKITAIRNELNKLQKKEHATTGVLFDEMEMKKAEQKDLFERQKRQQISTLEKELNYWMQVSTAFGKDSKPFVWDIDFAEIFYDEKQRGFDIVIGNPPYVRQEKIAPPQMNEKKYSDSEWREHKKAYKTKLQNMVVNLYGKTFKPDGKADLYVYFYFKALSLLNTKGAFAFITSNSWLDVGFGKTLQEFLLKRIKIYSVNDNQAKRSFKEADVNTIIIFTSAPFKNERENLAHTARFVMFKKPFALVSTKENLLKIDQTGLTIFDKDLTELVDNVVNSDDFRIFPIRQSDLFNDGAREDDGLKIYEGNKWGGKFLRAPDIFFTILKKGKGKLVRLGDIAEVRRGFTTGANEFFYVEDWTDKIDESQLERVENLHDLKSLREIEKKELRIVKPSKWGNNARDYKLFLVEAEYLKSVIKSPRELKTIVVREEDLKFKVLMCNKSKRELKDSLVLDYIKWGEKQKYHKRPTCAGRVNWWGLGKSHSGYTGWAMMHAERHNVLANPDKVELDHNFFEFNYLGSEQKLLTAICVCSISVLIKELFGRQYGGGSGPLKNEGVDLVNYIIFNPSTLSNVSQRLFFDKFDIYVKNNISPIFIEIGLNRNIPIRSQQPNPLPDRKELDDIVFGALGLTEDERREVYWAVAELVKNRLDKARSV